MTLTSKKLADLRTRAEKASPGPWTIRCRNSKYYNGDTHVALEEVIERFDPTDINDQNFLGACLRGPEEAGRGDFTVMDAAFIASFNPSTALGLLDWIDELEHNISNNLSAYKEMRKAAKDFTNDIDKLQSQLAESQADKDRLLGRIIRANDDNNYLRSTLLESQAREALLAKRLGPAGAEMLRNLVGVIKTLSAALNEIDDLWLDHKMPAFIAERVLASTLEIRERIGAT